MIAKGTTHDNGGKLAIYMTTGKPGERAELWQLRGFASDDIKVAFRSVHVMASATRCEQPLFHTYVRNPEGEHLTRDQWERVADRIESKLGLTDQPRAIAFHQDENSGHEHMHIGWSRIDDETMTAKPLPFFKLRLKEASRELETELGLTPVRNEREGSVMAPKRDEDEQARRLGVDVRDVRATIRECWERSDSGQSFAAALADKDIVLAKGERRDFIAIDREGGLHALGKRILGNTAGEVRARMADLVRAQLPDIEQAREQAAARREVVPEQLTIHAGNLSRRDAIDRSGKEATERKLVEPKLREPLVLTAAEPNIDASVSEIRRAYGIAGIPADFTAALERNGIRLATVSAVESERNGTHRSGEIVAVTQTGQVYQLNESTTGATRDEIERFLARLDRRDLCGIEATQERIDLEARRHIELSQVGLLPVPAPDKRPPVKAELQISKEASDDRPDWIRMLTDRAYRMQIEQKARERRTPGRQQQEPSHSRSRERDRY